MSEILTRREFEDFLHRAFSHVHFELDESGQLRGAHDQPFNRLLAHDAALRELKEKYEAIAHEQRERAEKADRYKAGMAEVIENLRKDPKRRNAELLRLRAERAEADRDRLRQVLQTIADHPSVEPGDPWPSDHARAALAETKP
jgi:seryl-tRNA synthetase